MKLNNKPSRTIWMNADDNATVFVYDQRVLPHEIRVESLKSVDDAANAIRDMTVRGAPLIGVTAAYGMYLAALNSKEDTVQNTLERGKALLATTRPTAVNLHWALDQQMEAIEGLTGQSEIVAKLKANAARLADEDVHTCKMIGQHGLDLIHAISSKKPGETINILTHCNAGWLATIDWGTATSPIYQARNEGYKVHVWVDETRPRNQGANLTAFELGQEGISHTLIADNTGGHLMQHGMVDIVITGTDRTTRNGDVANKIGTYLKALAAHDNNIPFYVALPSSTIDWNIRDGVKEIPIEQRSPDEVRMIRGLGKAGIEDVLLCPDSTPAANYGFDVTPARLVTGLITERGVCDASEEGLLSLFPEFATEQSLP